ncbi:MAG: hypothetical protein NZ895_05665 [Archaeoglobaceae archaeon]|nr:hypothetical protein [Archaeoglobaceae archaeon]MCX8151794.1 hypothetical protein [Archaeoglobaceae archaeon]MDW8013180.1 hypothetical protein [Archaeoglobaceae archaeon]
MKLVFLFLLLFVTFSCCTQLNGEKDAKNVSEQLDEIQDLEKMEEDLSQTIKNLEDLLKEIEDLQKELESLN